MPIEAAVLSGGSGGMVEVVLISERWPGGCTQRGYCETRKVPTQVQGKS